MVNIAVCMKLVIDPEAPISLFKIDAATNRAIPPKGTPPVLSPFDENALEAALKIKDTQAAKITIFSMGQKLARAILRTPLAAGADELYILEDPAFTDFDAYFTANILARAIQKLGGFDLILCGMQAADTNAGQVGFGIAENLGIPCIAVARKVDWVAGQARIERVVADGYEVMEVKAPLVVTTSYEVGSLREPSVEASMLAARKPVTIWNAQQLGIEPNITSKTNITNLFQPIHEGKCEIVNGPTIEDSATALVKKLKEVKVL